MPKALTSIEVWDALRAARIPVPGAAPVTYDLAQYIDGEVVVRDILSDVGTLTFELFAGSPPIVAPDLIARRRVLRLIFDDDTFEEWRVRRGVREYSGEQNGRVEAEPLWTDLGTRIARRSLTGGFVDLQWVMLRRNAQDLLTQLLADAPWPFAAGSAGAFAAAEATLQTDASTHLAVLAQLCEEVGAEWEAIYNPATELYEVHLVAERGGAGARPIQMGGSALLNNRVRLQRTRDASQYFSRVVPIGGPDDEAVTLARATWNVIAATETGGQTILTLADEPIYVDGAPGRDLEFGSEADGFYPVISTGVPGTVVVLGEASTLASGRFRLVDGSDLTYMADPDSEQSAGIVEKVERRTDVVPFDNLLLEAGVSADLSGWAAGLPVGFSAVGAAAIGQTNDDRYAQVGGLAALVDADAGDGIRTVSIPLETVRSPYFSAAAHIRIISGGVQFELVDFDGVRHPNGERATSNEQLMRALMIGGLTPAAGDAYLLITATEDDTQFALDAINLTNSSTAYEFADDMGPQALWHIAGRLLAEQGGLTEDAYEGTAFDASYLPGATQEEILIGTRVQVREGDLDFETRVVELTRRISRGESFRKEFKLSQRRGDMRWLTGGPRVRRRLPRGVTTPATGGDMYLELRETSRTPEETVREVIRGPLVDTILIWERELEFPFFEDPWAAFDAMDPTSYITDEQTVSFDVPPQRYLRVVRALPVHAASDRRGEALEFIIEPSMLEGDRIIGSRIRINRTDGSASVLLFGAEKTLSARYLTPIAVDPAPPAVVAIEESELIAIFAAGRATIALPADSVGPKELLGIAALPYVDDDGTGAGDVENHGDLYWDEDERPAPPFKLIEHQEPVELGRDITAWARLLNEGNYPVGVKYRTVRGILPGSWIDIEPAAEHNEVFEVSSTLIERHTVTIRFCAYGFVDGIYVQEVLDIGPFDWGKIPDPVATGDFSDDGVPSLSWQGDTDNAGGYAEAWPLADYPGDAAARAILLTRIYRSGRNGNADGLGSRAAVPGELWKFAFLGEGPAPDNLLASALALDVRTFGLPNAPGGSVRTLLHPSGTAAARLEGNAQTVSWKALSSTTGAPTAEDIRASDELLGQSITTDDLLTGLEAGDEIWLGAIAFDVNGNESPAVLRDQDVVGLQAAYLELDELIDNVSPASFSVIVRNPSGVPWTLYKRTRQAGSAVVPVTVASGSGADGVYMATVPVRKFHHSEIVFTLISIVNGVEVPFPLPSGPLDIGFSADITGCSGSFPLTELALTVSADTDTREVPGLPSIIGRAGTGVVVPPTDPNGADAQFVLEGQRSGTITATGIIVPDPGPGVVEPVTVWVAAVGHDNVVGPAQMFIVDRIGGDTATGVILREVSSYLGATTTDCGSGKKQAIKGYYNAPALPSGFTVNVELFMNEAEAALNTPAALTTTSAVVEHEIDYRKDPGPDEVPITFFARFTVWNGGTLIEERYSPTKKAELVPCDVV